MSTRANPFGFSFGRKKKPVGKAKGKARGAGCARSSTLSIGDAIHAARAAGRASGDTGGFEPWACRKGLDQKGNAFKRRLEAAYREGVEEPTAPRAPTRATAPTTPAGMSDVQADVVSALVNLKYKPRDAEAAVRAAHGDTFDAILKSALAGRRAALVSNPQTDYAIAKQVQSNLEEELRKYSAVLAAFPKGAMNLAPDYVKATPEWKAAKRNVDRAFAALRNFNSTFTKRYKKELAAERRNPVATPAYSRALALTRDPAFSSASPAAQAAILTLQRSHAS